MWSGAMRCFSRCAAICSVTPSASCAPSPAASTACCTCATQKASSAPSVVWPSRVPLARLLVLRGAVTTLVTEHPRRRGVAAGVLRPQPAAVHPGRRHRHRQSHRLLHRSSSIPPRRGRGSIDGILEQNQCPGFIFLPLCRVLIFILGLLCPWSTPRSGCVRRAAAL